MYADRLEAAANMSIKGRLNGLSTDGSSRRRQITGKRRREDDKWEHDLYEDSEPRLSNRKLSGQDLRLKLQKKSRNQASQSVKGTYSNVHDLREKLSGTMNSQLINDDLPIRKLEAAKLTRIRVAIEASEPESKEVATAAARIKSQQKAYTSLEGFLQSLSLEKYLITFQVEEVDMTTLVHMTDEDLKVLGIPMGPRKKILLALESKG